jgi:hypothetical protein
MSHEGGELTIGISAHVVLQNCFGDWNIDSGDWPVKRLSFVVAA